MFNSTMLASTIVLFLIGFLAIPSHNQSARWGMAAFVRTPLLSPSSLH